jgi:hypothetical protein
MPQSGLVAVTIEGASPGELGTTEAVEAGEELIDIAEYYGSTAIERATLVRYMQLKHSTLRCDDAWQPSGLEKTIQGFAERYTSLQRQLPADSLLEKVEFWFVTNRPIRLGLGGPEARFCFRPPGAQSGSMKRHMQFDESSVWRHACAVRGWR